jgi:Pyruvate/2-oxoglutarate dehydrogenase complex, dihydrolipoamide acyltransferase (E2) component, and related enzymes
MATADIPDSLKEKLVEIFGPNTAFVHELYAQYLENPSLLRDDWRTFFQALESGSLDLNALETHTSPNGSHLESSTNGTCYDSPSGSTPIATPSSRVTSPSYASLAELNLDIDDRAKPLSGVSALIAQNMELSLGVPTATSIRTIPVKALEENRLILNQHLQLIGRGKAAFTHLIAWAIVKAFKKYPSLNATYAVVSGKAQRIERAHINFGIAIDLTRKDGSRSLVVPNIKRADLMNFSQFFDACRSL